MKIKEKIKKMGKIRRKIIRIILGKELFNNFTSGIRQTNEKLDDIACFLQQDNVAIKSKLDFLSDWVEAQHTQLNNYGWILYASADWQELADFCKKNDIVVAWKLFPHDFWLAYVSVLWELGKKGEAVDVIRRYQKRYETFDIFRYVLAAQAAKYAGITSPEIEQAVYIADYIENNSNPLEKILENKTVAVVGNAPNIKTKKHGKEIDSHDIIIRFNNFQTVGFEEYCGKRTTLWMRNTGSPYVYDRLDVSEFKAVIWENDLFRFKILWNHLDILYRYIKIKTAVCFIPNDCFQDIKKILGMNPSMGSLIIHYLVNYANPASIDCYGFSFLDNSDTLSSHYFPDNSENLVTDSIWHNIQSENDYLQKLFAEREIK